MFIFRILQFVMLCKAEVLVAVKMSVVIFWVEHHVDFSRWRWKHYIPLKCWYPHTSPYSNTTQNTTMSVINHVKVFCFSGLFHQGPDPLGELQGSPASQKLPSFRHGRSLLWSDMDRRNFPSVEDPFSDVNPISNTSNIHATCPMFINQTESIR